MKNIYNFIIVSFRLLLSFIPVKALQKAGIIIVIIFFIYTGVVIWRDTCFAGGGISKETTFLYIQSIGSGIDGYNYAYALAPLIKLNKTGFNEFKMGWSLSKLPDHILKIENNIYVKLLKLIGSVCLFFIVSGIAQQLNKLIFYYIFIFSFLYSLYRLMIVLYFIKQFIFNVYTGKLIVVRSTSSVNTYLTVFRMMGNVTKTTVNFTVGTGITYALCYELDEILVLEGKDPYFVPGIRQIVKIIGAEEYAKQILNKLGITDRINTPAKRITDLLESMSEKDKIDYESETGQSWQQLYNEQKKLQESLNKFNASKK